MEVDVSVNYSGADLYKNVATRLVELLKKKYPGMKVDENRESGKSNLDIRMRKGVSGGDEFLHYFEKMPESELETRVI